MSAPRLHWMTLARCAAVLALLAATLTIESWPVDSLSRTLWPAAVAVSSIVLLRDAAGGLACGVASAALLLSGGSPVAALRIALADHGLPSIQGPWRVGALVFTLLLGAFAGVLERSGGFDGLLRRMLSGGRDPARRLLGGTYLIGLLCFFDGLASSLLSGRIARPLADGAGVSRERLAWVVDSTGSPVACVAFISTWIATQLSLIEQGLRAAPFKVDPYAMFFQSIPANPYCLLTLWIVPLAIVLGYQPRAMRKFRAMVPDGAIPDAIPAAPLRVVWVPLAVLVGGIVWGFPLLSKDPSDVTSIDGWRRAFSGDAGPYALVFGSLAGLLAAMACFPRGRSADARAAAAHGAGALLPALVVLVLAWTLGSMFEKLGTTREIAGLLAGNTAVGWLPLIVFGLGSTMSFTTGSSWGTMGLLMPLALPAAVTAAAMAGLPPESAQNLCVMVIGAVFGGATLGDHCSPFSDTTIVSAIASGCRTLDHVTSQLPFAMSTALAAASAYAAMTTGLPPAAATGIAAALLTGWVGWRHRRQRPDAPARHPVNPDLPKNA